MTAVVALDPCLLAPVGSRVPAAEAAAELAGAAGVLRLEGDWSAVAELPRADFPLVEQFLHELAALTIAVGASPASLPFDLRTRDPSEADRWLRGFTRAPRACLAASILVRDPPRDTWAGLVAESAVYSMLQAGPEFLAWREACAPARARRDDALRIRTGRAGRAAEVVLTRPARHNALDVRMRDELDAALAELEASPETQVIVRGEGPSFCSGGDLTEFGTFPDPATAHAVRLGRSLALRFAHLGPRMVVGVHGTCLGAGIELPAFAARVIAADDTTIGLPEAGLGLVPGAGGTVSITRRAGRQRLLELLITGEPIDATTARAWGLVDEVVARDSLEDRLGELAS